jgi:hypothetical protein
MQSSAVGPFLVLLCHGFAEAVREHLTRHRSVHQADRRQRRKARSSDQGVNLADVSSITIGFGDKKNPTGGSRRVYFDDIRLYRSQAN